MIIVWCPVYYYSDSKVLAEGQICISLRGDRFNNFSIAGKDGFYLHQVTRSTCILRGFPTKSRVSSVEFRPSLRISTNFQSSRLAFPLGLVCVSIWIFVWHLWKASHICVSSLVEKFLRNSCHVQTIKIITGSWRRKGSMVVDDLMNFNLKVAWFSIQLFCIKPSSIHN